MCERFAMTFARHIQTQTKKKTKCHVMEYYALRKTAETFQMY